MRKPTRGLRTEERILAAVLHQTDDRPLVLRRRPGVLARIAQRVRRSPPPAAHGVAGEGEG